MSIHLTPEAVEEVSRMISKEKREGIGLRLGVKGGGCSGLFYAMDFDTPREGDQVVEYGKLKVLVDPKSYLYLQGTTLDYMDSLQD